VRAGAGGKGHMRFIDRTLGAVFAIALMAVMVWASNAPLTAHRSADAVLRLAWSARPERVEKCRQRSADEQAGLPPHMRQPMECEGRTAEYRLQVRLEGALAVDRVVHGGGLRRDRRLYVFEEVAIPPGEANIDIRFDRITPNQAGPATDSNQSAAATPSPTATPSEAVPPHLSFARRLRFSPREVTLITYSPERRALDTVRAAVDNRTPESR
jgi:hypothetical protein